MNITQGFQGRIFIQFCISSMCFMCTKKPPKFFNGKFWSIRIRLCYQFYLSRDKTAEIMEEVCEVLKTYERIFGLKIFSRHKIFLVISWCRKGFVMLTPKPGSFMQLSWTFAGVLVWPKCFLYMCRDFKRILYEIYSE